MNIKAITEEIHAKLNALGLSDDPRNFVYYDSAYSGIKLHTKYQFSGKHMSWEIDYTTRRFMLLGWLILGGRLRFKK